MRKLMCIVLLFPPIFSYAKNCDKQNNMAICQVIHEDIDMFLSNGKSLYKYPSDIDNKKDEYVDLLIDSINQQKKQKEIKEVDIPLVAISILSEKNSDLRGCTNPECVRKYLTKNNIANTVMEMKKNGFIVRDGNFDNTVIKLKENNKFNQNDLKYTFKTNNDIYFSKIITILNNQNLVATYNKRRISGADYMIGGELYINGRDLALTPYNFETVIKNTLYACDELDIYFNKKVASDSCKRGIVQGFQEWVMVSANKNISKDAWYVGAQESVFNSPNPDLMTISFSHWAGRSRLAQSRINRSKI